MLGLSGLMGAELRTPNPDVMRAGKERAQRTAQPAGGYGVVERTRATKGILATTTTFTPGAYAEAAELGHRLTLRDRDAIAE